MSFRAGTALRRALVCVAALLISPQPSLRSWQAPADWVARSNTHTRVVLEAQARLAPEGAAQVGVSGVDDQITDLSAGVTRRVRESITGNQQELQRRLSAEQDPLVRQDLEILIESTRQQLRALDIGEQRLLPYTTLGQGLLPPRLLRKAVMEGFVPAR